MEKELGLAKIAGQKPYFWKSRIEILLE